VARSDSELIRLGHIAGAYGVRGWVRVASHTDPAAGILDHRVWRIRVDGTWVEVDVTAGRRHPRGVVAKLEGCDDRDTAESYSGAEIAVPRARLPALGEGDYYWTDLIGVSVVTRDGTILGVVDRLMHTGANDVLVVKGERETLIPFVEDQVVLKVDVDGGRITVDWDPEF
jgi:16S rRNA processing protein RimM